MSRLFILPLLLGCATLQAQQPATALEPTTAAQAPTRDTSYIDSQGTAHITRVVPIPKTISPEAQHRLSRPEPDQGPPQSLTERRKGTDAYTARARVEWTRLCPNQLVEDKVAGVPVRIVTPEGLPEANRDKVLLNLHGGGFNSDSGSYTESIPIAGYSKIKVVAVLYRLAPEHPFPAAVDDSVAVYKELLKTYQPSHIVLYGTSAGAILTAEVAARLKQLGLPLPSALGIFSGMGDYSRPGDSMAMYSLRGLSGHLDPPNPERALSEYTGGRDLRDPVLSPIFSDLHGLPPTLFVTSGRDLLLSGTINLHRAYLNAGVDARLVVFDALPHAFWYDSTLPEAIEANKMMADFFVQHLSKWALVCGEAYPLGTARRTRLVQHELLVANRNQLQHDELMASDFHLNEHPLIAFVPTLDPDRAKAFYRDLLGLRLTSEQLPFALVFDAHGTMLRVVVVKELTPPPYTALGWEVPNIQNAVATLAARGIQFQTYPNMNQDDLAIWTAPGGSKVAWFRDPDGNTLSLSQN